MKKTLLSMIFWAVLLLALVFVVAQSGQAQVLDNPASTYESAWTSINANQRFTVFTHDLGYLPSTLDVWVAFLVGGDTFDFSSAIPYENYLSGCLKVQAATQTTITLRNDCNAFLIVRVDAILFNP